jgi:hypothetical protein
VGSTRPYYCLPSAVGALDRVCELMRNIMGGVGGGKSGTCSLCSSELDVFSSVVVVFSDGAG